MSRVNQPFWSSVPLKESESFEVKNERLEHSVDELLEVIEKNISSTSVNAKDSHSEGSSLDKDLSGTTDNEIDPSPIKPLNLKQSTQPQKQMIPNIFNEVKNYDHSMSLKCGMHDILRLSSVPSSEELEFNTRINRTSSLSRLCGPRQISNSVVVKTFSTKSPLHKHNSSAKSTRDNSPSKKSVCFEESPPKVIKYDQLTPENSDNSVDDDSHLSEETFNPKWKVNVKPKHHPLPPLPPKHMIRTPSPTKDTSLGSSDDSQDFNSTKEDLNRSAISLGQRLDLVLNNEEISERVQNDKNFRGSGSPLKSLTKKEEELIFSIKNRDKIKEKENLRNFADQFEEDLRNNDKESHFLRLDPELRKRNSNSSLNEEERILLTNVIVKSEKPIPLSNGMKNVDPENLPILTDDLISQSTMNSYASAAITMNDDEQEYQKDAAAAAAAATTTTPTTPPPKPTRLPSDYSTQPISTTENSNFDISSKDAPNTHERKLTISSSITSGLSYISSITHKRTDSGHEIKIEKPELETVTPLKMPIPTETPVALNSGFNSSPFNDHITANVEFEESENNGLQSIQSSVGEYAAAHSLRDIFTNENLSLIENQTDHSTPILKRQDCAFDEAVHSVEDLHVASLTVLEANGEHNASFTDEFMGSGLFNSSDFKDQSARNTSTKADILADVVEDKDFISVKDVEAKDASKSESLVIKKEDQSTSDLRIALEEKAANLESFEKSIEESSSMSSVVINSNEQESKDASQLSKSPDPTAMDAVYTLSELKTEKVGESILELAREPEAEQDSKLSEDTTDPAPPDDEQDSKLFTQGEYRTLKPSSTGDLKANLPSYNSLLFHDKEPAPEEFEMPPTDYIAIWNGQPMPPHPEPKYSIRTRKPTPPKKVLKLLNRTFDNGFESEEEFDDTATCFTPERDCPLRISSNGNSFVTKSVSRSSFINLDTRRSSIIEKIKSVSDDSNITDSSLLPDISGSPSFANEFKEWDLAPTKTDTTELGELKKPNAFEVENIKSIWGTNNFSYTSNSDCRTVSFNTGKITDLLAKNGSKAEGAQVKSSNAQSRAIVENMENLAVAIEYDQDPYHDFYDEPSLERIMPVQRQLKESLSKQQQLLEQHSFKVVQTPPNKPIHLNATEPIEINPHQVKEDSDGRIISGNSYVSMFDLTDDFDRVVQLQYHNYAVRERKEIIIAANDSQENPLSDNESLFNTLDQNELAKPMVPSSNNLEYEKTNTHRFGSRVPSARQPLEDLSDNSLNTKYEPVNFHARVASAARSDRKASDSSVVYGVGDMKIDMKKQRQKQTGLSSVKSYQSFAQLPSDDKGRLYIRINSLTDINLDAIPNHKATFKLYLDNGKHRISTPKMSLSGKDVTLDKEFEIAIEEDITDLHLTVKAAFIRLENELVEVFDKIPLKTNRLSRVFGTKHKHKVEKSCNSRKRINDSWDNRFANDGSFAKNKITFETNDNEFTGETKNYVIELFNEWSTQEQSGKTYRVPPYLIAKLNTTMLYIPRTSPLETLPPSIKVAKTVSQHLIEQANIKFEGYLFQEGGDCDLWKRRFFKIEGTNLIAHNDTSKKPRAQINLLKVADISHSGKKKNNKRSTTEEILMSNTFKLIFKNGEIINFNAETAEARNQWTSTLEKVIELNRFHQPWVKLLAEKGNK